VAHEEAALFAEDDLRGLEGDETREGLLVDCFVAVLRDGKEVGMVRRRQRSDEVQRLTIEQLVVVFGVLSGVIDQGKLCTVAASAIGQKPFKARDELGHHHRELGNVGLVARIGVADERDGSVGGHHKPEADDAQVRPLLLGVPPLSDRGARIARIDPGGEVGHVEHETGQVHRERLEHRGDDPALDLFDLVFSDRVHCFPKALVVERS